MNLPNEPKSPTATLSARLAAWLVERYPDEFRRAHGAELRDASAWTLAASPSPLDTARLLANLAAGALTQHTSAFARDLRYATRTLRRSKWFAACALFSLAIGAGTVLPIYLTFSSTLFRNVEAIHAPETLVAAMEPISHPHYVALRDAPDSPFASLTAFMPRGLLLSAVGLAGVTAYAVALRTREIGIRMALGATGGRVIRLVLREGLGLLIGGSLLGLAFVALLVGVMRGYLAEFGKMSALKLTDPILLGGALALLVALSLAACYFPARRATRVNPVVALRE